MSIGLRIGQRQRVTLAQGGVSSIFGIRPDKQGMRPSALNLQVIRNAGTSAHSVTIEGAGDLAGPWELLATITDQLITKYTTKIPDYVRATAGTSTGGTVDVIIGGVVGGAAGGGGASNISLTTDTAPNQGTTTTLLHGNAAGQPSFGAVVQGDVTGGFVDLTNTQTVGGDKTFSSLANKNGENSIVADTAAINTTETVLVKTPALAANRLKAGSVIRINLRGKCTTTAANVPTFRLRYGTNGTTADAAIVTAALGASATSGTDKFFSIDILLTVRTTGAAATAGCQLVLFNGGSLGISTGAVTNADPTMATFDTTLANAIISCTFVSAATTTTCTFNQASIEVIYN